MATVLHYAPFLAIILLLQAHNSVTANFTIPFLPPLIGDNNPCNIDEVCGKGNCVVSNTSTFGYECDCDTGWKQAFSDHDDPFLNFLACVIPNCTINSNCGNAPAPVFDKQPEANSSYSSLLACLWADCGGGSCNNASLFTYTCDCDEGYFNLFNSTAFPSYRECAIGLDCASLGINLDNSTSSPNLNPSVASSPNSNPSTVDDSSSHAVSLRLRYEFDWMLTMATMLPLFVSKYR